MRSDARANCVGIASRALDCCGSQFSVPDDADALRLPHPAGRGIAFAPPGRGAIMMRSIWVKESEQTLIELGFRPLTSIAVARKINGTFTMAASYAVPEQDLDDVIQLLSACNVTYDVE
jgi:hypothetical protein